ncbi:MAG: choice-of-anchor I family protein [Planctomycetota bacterium]|nr:choice-of-anchor I family protein [Planctomycetota bacterium]
MYQGRNHFARFALHGMLLAFLWLGLSTNLFGDSLLTLHSLWSHAHGRFDKSAAEVVTCLPQQGRVYVTNADENCIDVLNLRTGELISRWDLSRMGRPKGLAACDEFIAVAVGAAQKTNNGKLLFLDPASGDVLEQLEVGATPDMVCIAPDQKTVLVANEGEPSENYDIDPSGTISLVRWRGIGQKPELQAVDFESFNPHRDQLIAQGIRICGPSKKHDDRWATVAEDLEPEYIAVAPDGKQAWITLQENNAIAMLDIGSRKITRIFTCGLKNHGQRGNGLDVSDRDGSDRDEEIKIEPAPIWGLYQPDAIATMEADGQIYLLTADEGDPRDYRGHSEVKNAGTTKIPTAISKQDQERLSRLEVSVSKVDRSQYPDRLLSFGGRSFSIRSTDGTLVFDSGDRLEREIARRWPAHFNSSHDRNAEMDDRSRKRGPEPEGITVGKVGDRTLAFIALERASVIAVYDVTDPTRPALLNMISGREASSSKADAPNKQDLGPETMAFIPASHSPTGKPLLLVAFEVSGTTRLYEVRGGGLLASS